MATGMSMTVPTCGTGNNSEGMACGSLIKGNRIPGTFPALSEVIPTQTSLRFQYVSLQLARLRNCVNLWFARHRCDRQGPKMVSGVTERCEQEIPYREGAGAGGWGGTEELVAKRAGGMVRGTRGRTPGDLRVQMVWNEQDS